MGDVRFVFIDEESDVELFEEALRRLAEELRQDLLADSRERPSPVFNGVCESQYGPRAVGRLKTHPGDYSPCYLNPAMLVGVQDIRDHLVLEHGVAVPLAFRLKAGNCYLLHDKIHIREEKKHGV